MSPTARWLGLLFFVALCLGAAALGSVATTSEIDGWYRNLKKPEWNPPSSVFAPVWTTLYLLMALAAWWVWKPAGFRAAARPLSLFALQLGLNVAWSWIFFGMHRPGWAFAELLVLWLAILATTIAFFARSGIAGALLLPYLAWVTFAGALNYTIWQLNAT